MWKKLHVYRGIKRGWMVLGHIKLVEAGIDSMNQVAFAIVSLSRMSIVSNYFALCFCIILPFNSCTITLTKPHYSSLWCLSASSIQWCDGMKCTWDSRKKKIQSAIHKPRYFIHDGGLIKKYSYNHRNWLLHAAKVPK